MPSATPTPSGIFARSLHYADTASPLQVALPSPIVNGDLLVGFAGFHYASADYGHTLPPGWTVVADVVRTSGAAAPQGIEDVLITFDTTSGPPTNPIFTMGSGNIDVALLDYAKGGGGKPVVDTFATSSCPFCNPLTSGALTSTGAGEQFVVDFESEEANGSVLSYTGSPTLNQLIYDPAVVYHYTLDVGVGAGPGPQYNFFNAGGSANSVTISVLLK